MKRLCAVTGATGHIGSRIAEILLERGAPVSIVARNREKMRPLVKKGAKVFAGSLEDREFLAKAFAGADGVFAMIPPNPQAADFRGFQNSVGAALAAAIEAAGVRHVVNLSSQGARLSEGTGPIVGLYDQEQRLNLLPDVHVVHLHPGFFMENLEPNIGLIRGKGINASPLRGDLRIPVIATRDIARVAADYLTSLDFSGKTVRDLLGQRDLTMFEMTRIVGEAVGNPGLRYVQLGYDAALKAMLGAGMSPNVAHLLIEMFEAFNDGPLMKGLTRTPENTTETPFEVFVQQLTAKN